MDLQQAGRSKRELIEVVALSWPVALLLSAGAAGLGIAVGSTAGTAHVILIVALVVVAAASGLVAWLRGTKTGGYKRAAGRYARLVAGAGQPVIVALGELCAEPAGGGADDVLLERLRNRVIETVRRQCGTTGVDEKRAAVFEFRGGLDLNLTSWAGRRTSPRTTFAASDLPHGRDVAEFAASTDGRVDRISDVASGEPRPRGLVRRDAGYASFMAAPISVGQKSWGMLTVDSPEKSAFRETDEGTLALLAGALAAGLAHAGVSPHPNNRANVTE